MNDFKENVEKYADLAIRTGVNLQLGQTLVIVAPIEAVGQSLRIRLKHGRKKYFPTNPSSRRLTNYGMLFSK
ncbi:hypothetical protein [Brevibacillus reuszeri]|uniref:hypothetical protein n=1 Tax=Brevibacillus reuszeri TaxID=54915 RepID=UPI0035E3E596